MCVSISVSPLGHMVHYNPDVTLSGWQDIKIQGPKSG